MPRIIGIGLGLTRPGGGLKGPQFARTISDSLVNTWTNELGAGVLWSSIDEAVASDADFIQTPNNTTVSCRMNVNVLTDPNSYDPHVIRFRARVNTGDSDQSLSFFLRNQTAGSYAAIRNTGTLPIGTWTLFEYALSSGEIDAIVDWGNLGFWLTGILSDPGTTPGRVQCSWAELQVPPAP